MLMHFFFFPSSTGDQTEGTVPLSYIPGSHLCISFFFLHLCISNERENALVKIKLSKQNKTKHSGIRLGWEGVAIFPILFKDCLLSVLDLAAHILLKKDSLLLKAKKQKPSTIVGTL